MVTPRRSLVLFVAALRCDPSFAQTVTPAQGVRVESPRLAPPGGVALPDEPPASPPSRGGVVPLQVPGFGAAAVLVPSGDGPRVVMVAAHGNYDRPEWQCEVWRGLVADRAFVLCPRGTARLDSPSRDDVRFTYRAQAAFNREVDAGLGALRQAYGARVSRGPIVYAGFSLGAIYGVGYLRATAERVVAAVLVEGGHSAWSDSAVRAFANKGGVAVVFGCGQAWCARDARRAMLRLRAARIATDVAFAPGSGHSYGGAVADALRPAFERLVAPTLQVAPTRGAALLRGWRPPSARGTGRDGPRRS